MSTNGPKKMMIVSGVLLAVLSAAGCGEKIPTGTVFTVAPIPVPSPPEGSDPAAEPAAMSQEEFCGFMAGVDASGDEATPESTITILKDAARRAPTEELRAAFEKLLPSLEETSGLESTGMEAALGLILTMTAQPELEEASTTIETYMSEVCGLEDADQGADAALAAERETLEPAVRAAVEQALVAQDPAAAIESSGSMSIGDDIALSFGIAGPDTLDVVAVCQAGLAPLADPALLGSYTVEILRAGTRVAGGTSAGGCAPG